MMSTRNCDLIVRSQLNGLQCLWETETCHSHVSLKVYFVNTWAKKKRKKSAAVESFRGLIRQVIAAEGWHIDN